MLLGVVFALGAACCFGTATILQSVASHRAVRRATRPRSLITRLAHEPAFIGGVGLDAVAFALSLSAARVLPLFLLHAITSASVGVTGILAARFLRERLEPTERLAIIALVVGLTLLTGSATAGDAHAAGPVQRAALFAGVPSLALVAVCVGRRRRPGPPLAMLSGAAFGAASIASRGIPDHHAALSVLADPLAWAALAFIGLGLLSFSVALQSGAATTVSVTCMAVEALLPGAIGIAFLGDTARPGLQAIAFVGFAATVAATLVLTLRRPIKPPTPHTRNAVPVAP